MKMLKPALILIVLLFSGFAIKANHVLGGNITWQCTGGNQYTITFTMYKDCFGATAALPTESVFFFPSAGCSSIPFIADLTLGSATEISDLCATELPNSSCNGGLTPGTHKVVYTGTVTLDPTCDWTAIWNSGDWNYFNNIDFSTLPDAFISSTINTSVVPCSTSPTVTSLAVPYECRNQGNVSNPITLNLPPGVTASFAVITPLTTGASTNAPINVPGYTDPLTVSVNPSTGALTVNTTGQSVGNFLITVQITLVSGGQTIGVINQNMAIVMRDCASTTTVFNTPNVQNLHSPAVLANPTTISACAGDSVCFEVEASNSNVFRSITLTANWDAVLNAGNPVFQPVGIGTNPARGQFCMKTNTATVGLGHNIHFHAVDDACVLPGSADLNITLNVYPNVNLSVYDTTICMGNSLPVTASGGASGAAYTWTPVSGDMTPGIVGTSATQNLNSISQDTEIEVSMSGVPGQCDARDTLTVQVSLQQLTTVVTDETCIQNDGAIDLTVVGGTGNYTYAWNNPANSSTQDISGQDSGNLCVTVTDTGIPNCTANTCATILTTPPPGGSISVQGGVTTLCEGSSATIVFDGTGANGQPFVITVTGTGAVVPPTINDLGTFTVNPPVGTTTYSLTSVAYQNFPACVTPTNSQVTFTVRPLVTGTLSSAGSVCNGSNLSLTLDMSSSAGANVAGSYNVTFNAAPADPAGAPNAPANPWTDGQVITLNPTATTTYSVTDIQYTDAPNCSNLQNNTLSVTVNPLPGATLNGATSVCAGSCANLTLTLTGTAPWNVTYTIDGVAQTPMVVNTSPYVWNLCPTGTSSYCITSVTDANSCTASISNQCATITVNPMPDVVFSGNTGICSGASADLSFVFNSPPGIYDMVLGVSNGPDLTISFNSALGTTYSVSPTATTTYTLNSVQSNTTGCTITPGTQVTVQVNGALAASNVTQTCNNISTAFTVEFTLTGTAPFVITPLGGTINGNIYTSAPITSGNTVSFTIDDAGACPPINVNLPQYDCPILTDAGTMSPTPLSICANGQAAGIWNNDGFQDGNDQQAFILHTTSDNTLGTVIATDCDDAIFGDSDSPLTFGAGPGQIQYGTTYYISSIVGDDSGDGNCVNQSAVNVDIAPGQPVVWYESPVATISGGGSICAGQTANVSVNLTAGAAPWNLTFAVDGVNQPPVNNISGNSYSVPLGVAGTYTIVSVSNNSCPGTGSGSAQVVVNPLPTAAITGPASTCTGVCVDITLTLTGTGPWTVNYTANGVAQAALVVNASPYLLNVCPVTTTAYCITSVTDANTCSTTYNNVCHTVTVNQLPTATLSAGTEVCTGLSHNFTVTFTGASPWNYTVSLPGGGTQNETANASPGTFSANTQGSYSISTVTDGNGCISSGSSAPETLTVNPLPTAVIAQPAPICVGQTATFNVTFTGEAPNISYTVDGPVTDQSPTSSSLNTTFSAGDSGDYSISTITDNNGCISAGPSAPVTLTVNPLPTAVITGPASTCIGTCVDLTLTLTGTGPWTVNYTAGGTPQPAVVVNTSPYLLNACPNSTTIYCITSVTDANTCSTTYNNNACHTITVNPLPTASFDANAEVCTGSSHNFIISFTGYSPWTYAVSTPGGSVNGGPSTNLAPFAATAQGNYSITTVTDNNGCVSSGSSAIVTLTVNPLPTAVVAQPSAICSGQSSTFNVTFTGEAPITSFSVDGPGSNDQNGLTSPSLNTTFTASAAGDYAISTITDNNGCVSAGSSAPATLTVNPLPTAAISGPASTCIGTCVDLTFTLTGTGPWTVNYTANGVAQPSLAIVNSPFVYNVCPNATTNYCITSVSDATTCSTTYNGNVCYSVTVNPLPTATLSQSAEICSGQTHNFTVSFTGAAPFDYSIVSPSGTETGLISSGSSATYNASDAGSYNVDTVTDNNGCISAAPSPTVTLGVNPLPTAVIVSPGTVCSGQTFNFDVTFSGEAPFTYDVDFPNPAPDLTNQSSLTPNGTFGATEAGNYVITSVTDNTGCVSAAPSAASTLTVNPAPTATLSPSTSICAGDTYSFTVTLSGVAPFDFGISQNGTMPPVATFTGESGPTVVYTTGVAGTYNVVNIVDDICNNLNPSPPVTLTVNPLPTAQWTGSNAAFCTGSTVQMPIALTGTAPWDIIYTIDGVDQPTVTIQSTPHNLTASVAGTYCIRQVTDANTCVRDQPAECRVVSETQVPVADAGPDLFTCTQEPIVIGTPAVPGVDYLWNNASLLANNHHIAQPTATITNNTTAPVNTTFNLTATIIANGISCTATDSMDLTTHPLPVIVIMADDDQICFGGTTTLTASGAGGGGQYVWISDLTSIQGPTNTGTVTVAPVGNVIYEVEGTDANGCVSSDSIDVFAGTDIIVQENYITDLCFNVCDGTIALTPSGGYGGYTVTWSGSPVSDPASLNQSSLCAGTYGYVITDSQGCNTAADNLDIVINSLPQNNIDDVVVTDPVCFGEITGQLQIVEPGAQNVTIYCDQCQQTEIGPQINPLFTDLESGTYDILVIDADGCEIEELDILITPQSPEITLSVNPFDQIFCYNDQINFTGMGQGGSGNLLMNWYSCPDTTGCLAGTGSPFSVTIVQDTILYGVITDSLNCRSDTASVSAVLNPPIEVEAQGGLDMDETCEGVCIDLTAAAQGGNANLVIEWYDVASGQPVGTVGNTQEVCPDVTTDYYAFASDGCGVPAADTITVNVLDTPDVLFDVDADEGCSPLEVHFYDLTDPTQIDHCQWDFGLGTTVDYCGDTSIVYTPLGSYYPTLTITGPNGCVGVDTLDTPITVHGYPEIDFTWEPQPMDVLHTEATFINLTEGGDTYHWTFGPFGQSTLHTPLPFNFPDVDLATFTICLESSTLYGCSDTLCRDMVIQSILQVWVPNTFTPNKDGVNDEFRPVVHGYDPEHYKLLIYDRWGNLIFETNNPQSAWTGNVQGGGYYAQVDAYVWRIELERLSDAKYEVFEGVVNLVR
ncbi:MAG: gliding motility-associated C-terminal domain-containing protein [Crocinitomicaceae bacterium]|nr:gliding motility-associated C-terminal domain-containing protein [Crocinitomicaceae bacterium]